MQQAVVLSVQALDRDGSVGEHDDIIDFIVATIPTEVSSNFSSPEQYPGEAGFANMTMSFHVTCSSNSYGSDCGTKYAKHETTLWATIPAAQQENWSA